LGSNAVTDKKKCGTRALGAERGLREHINAGKLVGTGGDQGTNPLEKKLQGSKTHRREKVRKKRRARVPGGQVTQALVRANRTTSRRQGPQS